MSGTETERKFLVHKEGTPWRREAVAAWHIMQGYIPAKGCTVRVRLREPDWGRRHSCLRDEERRQECLRPQSAFLTIKGPSIDGLSRYEFEHEISHDEAMHLLHLCCGGVIDKTRYIVPCGSHTVEVDEFHALNDGLVIAEIELQAPDEPYDRPTWLADEVTGQRRYYNSHLLLHPFTAW